LRRRRQRQGRGQERRRVVPGPAWHRIAMAVYFPKERATMGKTKEKKRKKVLVTPAVRMQDGKPTEPYRLLEELVGEFRDDLTEARIEILWRAGWRPDADGWVEIAKVKKAGDVDKALGLKADFAILLNKERFPKLTDRLKRVYLHHSLCHMRPSFDADGEQKQDDKGRKLWRVVKRHDIEQFSETVSVYGNDALRLDEEAKAAVAAAEKPLIAKAEEAEKQRTEAAQSAAAESGDDWQSEPLGVLDLDDAVETYVADAGHKTLGSLSQYMQAKGDFWAKDLTVGGRRKPAKFREKIEDAFAAFWAKRAAK
jgi:hypothetical protein